MGVKLEDKERYLPEPNQNEHSQILRQLNWQIGCLQAQLWHSIENYDKSTANKQTTNGLFSE